MTETSPGSKVNSRLSALVRTVWEIGSPGQRMLKTSGVHRTSDTAGRPLRDFANCGRSRQPTAGAPYFTTLGVSEVSQGTIAQQFRIVRRKPRNDLRFAHAVLDRDCSKRHQALQKAPRDHDILDFSIR
jgi:hypothetical protein